MQEDKPKLGIVAGGGTLPLEVAAAAVEDGRKLHIIAIEGEADGDFSGFPHDYVKWGQVGRFFSLLRDNQCRELVIIGRVRRPDFKSMRLDMGAVKLLPFIASLKKGGDDEILSRVAALFEERGHILRSPLDVAPALALPRGGLTGGPLADDCREDMQKGLDLLTALGPFDVGQAVVVVRGHVLAVEGAEGTDAMLERCASLRQWGRRKKAGVLVKIPKPGQDRRLDLPTIGPGSVERAVRAGLAGIVAAAGETLVAECPKTIAKAKAVGLFIYGISPTAAGYDLG